MALLVRILISLAAAVVAFLLGQVLISVLAFVVAPWVAWGIRLEREGHPVAKALDYENYGHE